LKKILEWDEHKIGIEAICSRLGYRSDYLLNYGITNAHVTYRQKQFGKNEISTFYGNIRKYVFGVFG
jgi:hypothetical protein